MFRASPTNTLPDMFSNIYGHLDATRQKRLDDKNAWHNLFYRHITSQIDERRFASLFSARMGAPNVPVRILIAMMILKEGFGWSDEMIYEDAEFDLRVMRSLGLNNVSDQVPCLATYYNFKQALYEHGVKTGENLLGDLFERLTRNQAKLFGVNGKFARMDSKLIGSNIAKCCRLQLVLSVLQVFYQDIAEQGLTQKIAGEDLKDLGNWVKRTPGQIVYGLSNEEKTAMLEDLGYMLMRIQDKYSEAESAQYRLIVRVLSEQYHIVGQQITLRDPKEISSDSLQSPYDEDAAYRNKKGEGVQGYSINITETCNSQALNLITDVKVEKANHSDNEFLQGAVERSEQIVGPVENLNADGAYHSPENQQFAEENGTHLILGGIQGKESQYQFNIKSEDEVEVVNKKTGEAHQAERYKEDGYRIRENGNLRYFTKAMLITYLLRMQIGQVPQSERNRRNNVEATIFQLCFHSRNNKTRYRGLFRQEIWAYSRCAWINFVRIKNYLTTPKGWVCPDGTKTPKNQEILTKAEGYVESGVEILTGWVKKLLPGIPKMIPAIIPA